VVIEKPGARTPSASDNSGAFRYVGERAVPIVMVEHVPSIACHVDVFETIIVVVTHRHTHRIVVLRRPSEAGFFRHVRECAIGVLMIKPVPKPAIGLVRKLAVRHRIVDLRAVGEEDVFIIASRDLAMRLVRQTHGRYYMVIPGTVLPVSICT